MTTTNVQKDSIVTANPAYNDALKQWELVEDTTQGQAAVKSKGVKYLPMPNPTDDSEENKSRYQQYLDRAVFYNTCFRTLSGMVGVAFRKLPKVEIPTDIEYLVDNVDGAGLSLNQQAQNTLSEVIKKGRKGLFVDYPSMQGDTSRADVERGIRATIKSYNAEQILDWNEEITETGKRLNYVKFVENRETVDIQTGYRSCELVYIMLRLVDGIYSIQEYNDTSSPLTEEITPRKANGQTFDYIPFIFCGSENNTPDIDQALLYDLSVINIGHYRNSADNEEASYITGQPTLAVTSSLDADTWKEQNPNGVLIGSRRGHFLGESGDLKMVQADPNNLPKELMKDKENQMVSLGAQLVSPSQQETAFTTGVNLATNTSALALAVGNVSDAYQKCLNWVMDYMGTTGEVTYKLNTDFFPVTMDAPTITAWVAGIQGGVLPKSAFYEMMRDANITGLTDDEIESETSSTGLNLNLGTNTDG